MGYTTQFEGSFILDKPLTAEQVAYLEAFSRTRRMKRDATKTADLPDFLRTSIGLPVGDEGGYFVGAGSNMGQESTFDVIDYNTPPSGQPGLWCQWTPSDDGSEIVWDEGEKFYDYVKWIKYIIDHFLKPWGYVVNGEVAWEGESSGDLGKIVVTNNEVETLEGKVSYS